MVVIPFRPRPDHAVNSSPQEATPRIERRVGGRGSANPYDGKLSGSDYRQVLRYIRSVEQQIGGVEILLKFGGIGQSGRRQGLVARSGATGKRYLFRRAEAQWLIASPAELEYEVRELDRIAALGRAALGLLGHQWSGE